MCVSPPKLKECEASSFLPRFAICGGSIVPHASSSVTTAALFRLRTYTCASRPTLIACVIPAACPHVFPSPADANAGTIATTGGIEAVARAMVNHADDDDVQTQAVSAIKNVVWNIPAHIAMAGEAGVVPLLQHAAAMGIARAARQLRRMGM